MFSRAFMLIILSSLLLGQNYRWPIRASQSLSATFAEPRSRHLHAGIDIKTWGEMEVPCLAVADGYIEHIAVGYNGYGRGLWLRLNDGNVALYGHLEQFTPQLETLIRQQQQADQKYSLRITFEPDDFPVESGSVIGYSGTSGTEHPHLHFEIRDSHGHLQNPQQFYPRIQDGIAPVFDQLMMTPRGRDSRINGSHFPVIFNMDNPVKRVSTTGPFTVSVNAHDRADGTYNKYNVYEVQLLVNDSLQFERVFDGVSQTLADELEMVYPGVKGRRGWKFMSLYNLSLDSAAPFVAWGLDGIIEPSGLSDLRIRLADIKGNQVSKRLIFHEQILAQWGLRIEGTSYTITRTFPEGGYENIQFYTGDNTHIPITETLYTLTSTSWVLGAKDLSSGVRALGSAGGQIKWIIPPAGQVAPQLNHRWSQKGDGYILVLTSEESYVFPLAYSLTAGQTLKRGELTQVSETTSESGVISLEERALAEEVLLQLDSNLLASHSLTPLQSIQPGHQISIPFDLPQAQLVIDNLGVSTLYVGADTTSDQFDGQRVQGLSLQFLNSDDGEFSSILRFVEPDLGPGWGIYSPGKKGVWRRLNQNHTEGQFEVALTNGGEFYLLKDSIAPKIKPRQAYTNVSRGDRLVFLVTEATQVLDYPKNGIRARLDGTLFFPDFNPLRKELSFHVPRRIGGGQHLFECSLRDGSGNEVQFKHRFTVNP